MASVTRRGTKWLVQIRRMGIPAQTRTFTSHAAAKSWAAQEEARIERGEIPVARKELSTTSLRDLLERYIVEITPTKRSAETEKLRITSFMRDTLCDMTLDRLTGRYIALYRDRRLTAVSSSTVRRELAIVRHAIEVARKEWGLPLTGNPVAEIRYPPLKDGRDRRLEAGELERLMEALARCQSRELSQIVLLAIETGLRRAELLNLSWKHIDLRRRMAHIPITKTGKPRTIPLTDAACDILSDCPRSAGHVFNMSANAVRHGWVRAVARAELVDLHMHDLRHEAISRYFEMGLSLVEVASISGHKDPRMLFRYTHLQPMALAEKLTGMKWVAPSTTVMMACQSAN